MFFTFELHKTSPNKKREPCEKAAALEDIHLLGSLKPSEKCKESYFEVKPSFVVSCVLGRWVEDHEVVHNMMFNTSTNLKLPFKQTMGKSEWFDNGVLPLWITAQNQVRSGWLIIIETDFEAILNQQRINLQWRIHCNLINIVLKQ